ncbi:MAG: sulfite exporter TauE/SafE family protein [Flavobacteriales bacterium]|nr:sulfite exporter TauE/SafE family protein [Flavobacteriales bacterium]
MELLLLFFGLTLLAEVLGTIGGFGSSVFFVPLAGFFFDFQSVLGITAGFHVLSNLTKIVIFREGTDMRLLLWMGIPSVVLVITGSYLSSILATGWLKVALAVFIIMLSLVFLLRPSFRFDASHRNALLGGGFSGFAAGLVGTGGALRGLVMAAFDLPKGTFIATSAMIDLGTDASRFVVYAMNGFVLWKDLILIPVLLIASIIGTLAGKKILSAIPQEKFRRFVLYLIFGIGIFSLADACKICVVSR